MGRYIAKMVPPIKQLMSSIREDSDHYEDRTDVERKRQRELQRLGLATNTLRRQNAYADVPFGVAGGKC